MSIDFEKWNHILAIIFKFADLTVVFYTFMREMWVETGGQMWYDKGRMSKTERTTAMTERLYNENAYTAAFPARVLACAADGDGFAVVLDRTAFFPEGGGQGGDRGYIGDA